MNESTELALRLCEEMGISFVPNKGETTVGWMSFAPEDFGRMFSNGLNEPLIVKSHAPYGYKYRADDLNVCSFECSLSGKENSFRFIYDGFPAA